MPPTLAAARNTYCGRCSAKKRSDLVLAAQIELAAGAQQQASAPPAAQAPQQRRADQAGVAGDIDRRFAGPHRYS